MAAIITGTSSGIGKATALLLTENNIEVLGFSRTPSDIQNPLFKEYLIDLTDLKAFEKLLREIKKEKEISVIINNAGCGYYGLHEELNASMIHEMVTVNLEVPMLLTSIFLREFKKNKGQIINISSVTAKETNPHGAAYGATKAGLTSFGNSIFAEARKYGVRVTNIHPEMTATDLYRNADFEADTDFGCSLMPSLIADAVLKVLKSPEGFSVNDITINPQYHRIKRK